MNKCQNCGQDTSRETLCSICGLAGIGEMLRDESESLEAELVREEIPLYRAEPIDFELSASTQRELELLNKRISIINRDINDAEIELDGIAGYIECARAQRDRAIKRINDILIEDAVKYPTFIDFGEAA